MSSSSINVIWKPERKSTKGKLLGQERKRKMYEVGGGVKFSDKEKTKQTGGELSPNILCLGGAKYWVEP